MQLTLRCNCGGTFTYDDGRFEIQCLAFAAGVTTGLPERDLDESQRAAANKLNGHGGRCDRCGAWLKLAAAIETVWRVEVGP